MANDDDDDENDMIKTFPLYIDSHFVKEFSSLFDLSVYIKQLDLDLGKIRTFKNNAGIVIYTIESSDKLSDEDKGNNKNDLSDEEKTKIVDDLISGSKEDPGGIDGEDVSQWYDDVVDVINDYVGTYFDPTDPKFEKIYEEIMEKSMEFYDQYKDKKEAIIKFEKWLYAFALKKEM